MDESLVNGREVWAKEYDAIHNRLFVVQILWVVVLLAVYQFSGISGFLAQSLATHFGPNLWYVTNAAYSAIAIFGFAACMFPLSYYGDHVLERHYEFSEETFAEWIFSFAKTLLIDLVLGSLLFSVIYALLRWVPEVWWWFATLFYILFGVIFSAVLPVVSMSLAHQFESLEEGDLSQAVRVMMEEVGIEVVAIFRQESDVATAMLVGMGRSRRILLSDPLLTGYSKEEILAILAHEVGHYRNRDTVRLMFTGSMLALAGFYVAHLCLVWLSEALGFLSIYDIGTVPLFIFSLFLFSLVSMPFSNMHSRRREFAADAYAVAAMNSSDALVSALEKLADQNLSNKEPAAWIEFLMHSHPSIARRIGRARTVLDSTPRV